MNKPIQMDCPKDAEGVQSMADAGCRFAQPHELSRRDRTGGVRGQNPQPKASSRCCKPDAETLVLPSRLGRRTECRFGGVARYPGSRSHCSGGAESSSKWPIAQPPTDCGIGIRSFDPNGSNGPTGRDLSAFLERHRRCPRRCGRIVDNTATGSTLTANRLEIIDTLMTLRLAYTPTPSPENPNRRNLIQDFVLLLTSVIEARNRVMLEFNVGGEALEQVVGLFRVCANPRFRLCIAMTLCGKSRRSTKPAFRSHSRVETSRLHRCGGQPNRPNRALTEEYEPDQSNAQYLAFFDPYAVPRHPAPISLRLDGNEGPRRRNRSWNASRT